MRWGMVIALLAFGCGKNGTESGSELASATSPTKAPRMLIAPSLDAIAPEHAALVGFASSQRRIAPLTAGERGNCAATMGVQPDWVFDAAGNWNMAHLQPMKTPVIAVKVAGSAAQPGYANLDLRALDAGASLHGLCVIVEGTNNYLKLNLELAVTKTHIRAIGDKNVAIYRQTTGRTEIVKETNGSDTPDEYKNIMRIVQKGVKCDFHPTSGWVYECRSI